MLINRKEPNQSNLSSLCFFSTV